MKELAHSEQDTDITIALGLTSNNKAKITTWQDMNGILIAGKAGSTKTNTAVWLANQLAMNGVKLVRMDFLSDDTNPQTFLAQTRHLAYADILPPSIEFDEIQSTIKAIYELGKRRRIKGSWDNLHKYPVAVFIDEITTLLAQPVTDVTLSQVEQLDDGTKVTSKTKSKKMLPIMIEIIQQFRKDNIRFVVMGQDFRSTGNASDVARFRGQFNTVLLHKLSDKDVKLLEPSYDKVMIETIGNLGKGQYIYNGKKIYVPFVRNMPKLLIRASEAAEEYEWINLDLWKEKYCGKDTKTTTNYEKIKGTWSNTRTLAYLLNVDYDSLTDKKKYNIPRLKVSTDELNARIREVYADE